MKNIKLSNFVWGLLILLTLGLCSYWVLGFAGFSPSQKYLGEPGYELEGWMWRFWWVKRMLSTAWHSGVSPGYMCWLIAVAGSYPETGNLFDLISMSWPLEALFGAPLYFNVKVWLIFTLNGLCGFLLGKEVFKDKCAALVCGLTMLLSPYCLSEVGCGRVRQTVLFPMILYCWAFIRLYKKPDLWRAVWVGLFAGLASVIYLFYGLSLLIFTLLFVFCAFIFKIYGPFSRKRFFFLILTCLIAILASLPSVAAYISALHRGDPLPEMIFFKEFPSLNVLIGVDRGAVVQQNDPLLNSFQRFRNDSLPWQYPFMLKYFRCIPISVTVTALCALPLLIFCEYLTRRQGRDKEKADGGPSQRPQEGGERLRSQDFLPWLAAALLFYLLTLGPYLKDGYTMDYIDAGNGGIPNIYLLFFRYFPAFARLFSPVRLCGLLTISLGVLCGGALAALDRLWKRRYLTWTTAALFALLTCFSLEVCRAVPLPVCAFETPGCYERLGAKKGMFTVFEAPIRTGDYLQLYQITHGKKLVFGWADDALPHNFPQSDLQAFCDVDLELPNNTFLKYIESLNSNPDSDIEFDYNDYRHMVENMKLEYMVVHERSCWIINPSEGDKFFDKYCESIETLFGKPVDTDYEYVETSGGKFRYRINVYRIDQLKLQ